MNYQKMLKAYYANCELNLPIEEINHRYFRFDVLGRFVKIKKSIKGYFIAMHLQTHITQYQNGLAQEKLNQRIKQKA